MDDASSTICNDAINASSSRASEVLAFFCSHQANDYWKLTESKWLVAQDVSDLQDGVGFVVVLFCLNNNV
ncbi:hypothetical protein DD237_008198 [Peronospora effusa]|uniref:Uncharacterized protein n=1 Tax=Peronospora effusa TaxID=542832 RepID=A0A425CP70_9STRA|nr:hypothetical protein DD237_008198 [Peronospora effusa]